MSISSKKSSAMERDSILSLLVGNTKPDMKNLVKLRRRLKLRELALAHTRLWSERTTIEGVPHLMAAHSVQRKFCWAIIMLTVTILGLVHLVRSVQDFLASGVASQVTVDAAPAEFPSVTLCSLKPASESLLSYYRPVMDRHLERHWGYFDAWFTHQRRQGKTESYRDYRLRIVKVLAKMLEVLWVSDDTRDLSLLDYSTILECQFNGQPCNKKNFSLVQHYRHWNCYMFRPHSSLRYDNPTGEHNAGLMLNIFADSNFFSSTSSSHSEYNRSRRDSNRDYRIEGLSLRQFLADDSEFRLNRLLDVNHLSSDGMQVILHPTGSYPMFYKTRFTVKNSESAILHVFSMERNRINQADSPCSSRPLGTIDYVTNFGIGPDNQKRREFTESVEDVLNDRIQDLIYQRCGCYSHRMPFRVGKSLLCYYAPLQYRKQPSSELLTQIYCHDYWYQKFIGISELDDVSTVVRPCHETYREMAHGRGPGIGDHFVLSTPVGKRHGIVRTERPP
ncbi:hypothetical protein BOX15_Mlig006976g1 [Macrostomum lignano]|uniref:Amiloride-sensitive sodium channel n=1 Tax=Macrostomum lignano TaxID=282301 RepID=A0A267FRW6_9PLAT|nr:hypothetical protein BOX15_Mlig006976g1 [Macrostomum lignano]